MAIDAATVRKVAHLARIKTPEDRLEPLAQELNGILKWIEQLDEVDVQGVEPMTSNVSQPLRLRDLPAPLVIEEGGRLVAALPRREGPRALRHFVELEVAVGVDRRVQVERTRVVG